MRPSVFKQPVELRIVGIINPEIASDSLDITHKTSSLFFLDLTGPTGIFRTGIKPGQGLQSIRTCCRISRRRCLQLIADCLKGIISRPLVSDQLELELGCLTDKGLGTLPVNTRKLNQNPVPTNFLDYRLKNSELVHPVANNFKCPVASVSRFLFCQL